MGWYQVKSSEAVEIAERVSSEMSVGSLVFYGLFLVLGVLIVGNIVQAADRAFLFLTEVVPGPAARSPRSIRFAAGVIVFLSLIGVVVEVNEGLA
ncbi:hypothetical protein ACIPK5_33540 [Streptomyces sp. NPDC086843]|uniref:hypothetical protein n=1 Tax=Streptomyces sp. NPDC086843 TaxID=3365763 RepID=UPI0037FE25C6